ncbi:MAG: haloalkane dehalogenase [Gammaproteobacteria bacterium]|nr:haloalkane dehalogenase [Gammaproteobacteria bacterium]MDH3372602.1 haloalkane dehalogenase [Gammaproteobacteria bacterium]MDH3409477.1 haloalkane dehalogenase [Gammaproteobacteria bacterium]
MNALRTPDYRFANLPGYGFEPNYVEIAGLRMHYVGAGPADAAPVLLLHGEPSWSYLYRKMIPPLASAGHRVVAPDLIGFGRSDKPAARSDYSYAGHVNWMRQFIEALDLNDITLFCQNWGSLIGLRVAAENQHRFARIALGNGGMPTGDEEFPRAFRIWRAFARWSPWFPVGRIVQSGTVNDLTKAEVAAYDAPFPSARYKAGARAFPALVPTGPDDVASDDNRRAWQLLSTFDKPFLTTFSNRDPITRGGERPFQDRVPGARNIEHVKIRNAGHFLQEDKGEELAEVLISFIGSS